MCCRYGSGLHSHPVCTCLVDRHTKKCFIRPQKTLAVPPNFRHQHPTHCRIYRFHQRLLPLPPDCTLCPRQEPACVQPTARNLSWTSASTSSLLQHQPSTSCASPLARTPGSSSTLPTRPVVYTGLGVTVRKFENSVRGAKRVCARRRRDFFSNTALYLSTFICNFQYLS